ncbi:uncharacterized protein BO95DRAFT_285878 [Aspergillus brunneoviolaceus CBS 621.78]|uniref:Uncharacterized protein n=1 Tax=Aspergillus brunneoviolaceus CBS 621.78 TaxID=1450534 RepID=A0ACD1GJS7_9EURO|nr:hypothetical protein BO95DRAFT_285878 [Aspergillus brunneoviolaceus CBS 621.78]RAH49472.1 hypothetical protein BO95DRAFT_285878 [Aspergillus brunneoviolaceus CBS 621.78]
MLSVGGSSPHGNFSSRRQCAGSLLHYFLSRAKEETLKWKGKKACYTNTRDCVGFVIPRTCSVLLFCGFFLFLFFLPVIGTTGEAHPFYLLADCLCFALLCFALLCFALFFFSLMVSGWLLSCLL